MYKDKFVEKLKTEVKAFGLSNEAIDRIASTREKTITEEAQVETAVKDAETMSLIAGELQKMRDREIQNKTDLQRAFEEYKAKHPEGSTEPSQQQQQQQQEQQPDLKAMIAEAVAEAVTPLTTELNALKNSSSAKEALASAKDKFFSGDYAKKYKDQAEEAWDRAVEMNEATGSKMNAEELNAKAVGYFNKLVSKIGVDPSKPFQPDKQVDDKGTLDWSAEKKRLQDAGKLPKPENQ
jgi:hypothetical protein